MRDQWQDEPDEQGRWWFQGRISDEHEPMFEIVNLAEGRDEILVTSEDCNCDRCCIDCECRQWGRSIEHWVGTWLPVTEPDPDMDGDKETLRYMGYEV